MSTPTTDPTVAPGPTIAPERISEREAEVLAAVGEHLTNAEIAEQLYISVRTVESHVSSLLRKLGVSDRRALALLATVTDDETASIGGDRVPRSFVPNVPTAFVGRAHELAQIRTALADHRLVTLVGPGGAGKTRLAIEVAKGRPAVFVDLSVLSADADADAVARAVAKSMAMIEPSLRPVDAVVGHLAQTPRLVVLDNTEHVLEGAAVLAASLAATESGQVLATSRERLAVPAEHVVPIGPSDIDDAIALFVQRARAADPTVELDDELVATLCRQLDRLPLAIELAAARLGAIGLADLTDRLDDALDLLGGGDRTNVRHRSIRGALDWSHALLEPETQALHRRLSVLPGPFRLAVAEQVAGAPGERSVAIGVAQLVEASMLERRGDRYRQLDLVRADAAERLAAAGNDRAATGERLVTWALESLADAVVDGDEDDLVAAVTWALGAGDPRVGELAVQMAPVWATRGLGADAQRLYELAARSSGDPRPALVGAELAWSRWQGDTAIRLFLLAAELGERRADHGRVAIGLAGAVEVASRFSGAVSDVPDVDALRARVAEAERAAAQADDPDGYIAARLAVAAAFADVPCFLPGDSDKAERAVALAERCGDPIVLSSALDALTSVQIYSGSIEAGISSINRRFTVLAGQGHEPRAIIERVDNLCMAADCTLKLGEFETSWAHADKLRDVEIERGFLHSGWARLATATFFLSRWDDCLDHAERLVAAWEREQRVRAGWLGTPFTCAGAVLGYRGDDAGAAYWFQLARDATSAMPGSRDVQAALAADVHLHHGRRDDAIARISEPFEDDKRWWAALHAAVRAEAIGAEAIADAENVLAIDQFSSAVLARATGDLDAALAGFERSGSPYHVARTQLLAGDRVGAADRSAAEAVYRSLGLAVPAGGRIWGT